MSWQQYLLITQWIHIIWEYFIENQTIQFLDHKANQIELIQIVTQMNANKISYKLFTDMEISGFGICDVEGDAEVGPEIRKTLVTGV